MTPVLMPVWNGQDENNSSVKQEAERLLRELVENLKIFGVEVEIVDYNSGPVFTLFRVLLAPGTVGRRLTALENDLARTLCVMSVQVIEHLSGTAYAGILIRNTVRRKLMLSTLLNYISATPLPSTLSCILGISIFGDPVVVDIRTLPHLLIGGMTGSGKSILLNSLMLGVLSRVGPETVRCMLIAPRPLTFANFAELPHMLTDVIEDGHEALNALRWINNETERRFKLMSALGTTKLSAYNEVAQQAEDLGRPIPDPFWSGDNAAVLGQPILTALPIILVVLDDIADLILSSANIVEEMIFRLVQKAHIAGIHLIISTQRPSIEVISGRIKANIPARIAFAMAGKADSRTILDRDGAEDLLGEGDMLFMSPDTPEPLRLQGAWPSGQDVHHLVHFWKNRFPVQYINGITSGGEEEIVLPDDSELDPLYDEAVNIVIANRSPSVSRLQRALRISYNRASRIIEKMEADKLVSPPDSDGVRHVRVPVEQHKTCQENDEMSDSHVSVLQILPCPEQKSVVVEEIEFQPPGIFTRLVSWLRR